MRMAVAMPVHILAVQAGDDSSDFHTPYDNIIKRDGTCPQAHGCARGPGVNG